MNKAPNTKLCTKCSRRRRTKFFHRDRTSKDGRHRYCSACRNEAAHAWHTKNAKPKADYNRRSILMKKYGITLEQYDAMLKAQKGVCAICGAAPKTQRLHVDHNHKTKKVRGLLCWFCNRALGLLRDNPEFARAAARYLAIPPASKVL